MNTESINELAQAPITYRRNRTDVPCVCRQSREARDQRDFNKWVANLRSELAIEAGAIKICPSAVRMSGTRVTGWHGRRTSLASHCVFTMVCRRPRSSEY